MSGQWIKRKADEHKCQMPTWTRDVARGDIWQCNCGRQWKVDSISWGDYRETYDTPLIMWVIHLPSSEQESA